MSEYVYFKFKFHRKRYRRLLERITEQADGESENLALRDLAIIWFENERRSNLPPLGQPCARQSGQKQAIPEASPISTEEQIESDLADLDDAW